MDKKKVTIVGVVVAILVVMVGFFVVNQKGSIQKDLMSQEWTMYDSKTNDPNPDKVRVRFTSDKMIIYPNHSENPVEFSYQINDNVFSLIPESESAKEHNDLFDNTPDNGRATYKVSIQKEGLNYQLGDDEQEYKLVPRLNG